MTMTHLPCIKQNVITYSTKKLFTEKLYTKVSYFTCDTTLNTIYIILYIIDGNIIKSFRHIYDSHCVRYYTRRMSFVNLME